MSVHIQSVRVRTTIGASLVVLVALVGTGVALVATLYRSQIAAVDASLELRATDIESLMDGGAPPASVAVQSDEEGLVQIVDDSGDVVAASGNIDGEAPITVRSSESTFSQRVESVDEERLRIHVHPTDGSSQPYTIIVGSTLDDLEQTQKDLVRALAIGLPFLLAVIASMVWIVVGRALHPVEAIRAEVAGIGGSDLHRRVPVPSAKDEIGRLATTMNAMLDRLEGSSERQARFVSDASHELRTPIAVIRHEIDVALAGGAATTIEMWEATGRDLLDEDLRMQRLVDDLLFMARRDQHGSGLDTVRAILLDLDDLVLEEIVRRPVDKTIDVTDLSAGQVRGDRDQLSRVIRNLLDNALRHASSRVAISITSADGTVTLLVDDDGPGVSPDSAERVFQRFGRADDARARQDGGSGLGLAIVREIVSDHGGSVVVGDSSKLAGASFAVRLPDARRAG